MSRDIRICDQERPETSREIRLCDPKALPRGPQSIVICDQEAECPPDAPEFVFEVDSENNQMRVTSGAAPVRRILGSPCGTGEPGEEIAIGQWVGLTCKCYTVLRDACGRETSQAFGMPANMTPPSLSGPDVMANGSVYSVTAGDAPFGWFVPPGVAQYSVSEDTRSVTIVDIGSSCGGNIKAIDACRRESIKVVTVGAPLSLTGTDAPSVGSQYSASGGKPPYTWGISCGAISDTGQVTSLSGCCGSGTVTVTDACGQSVSLEVRFPNGVWVHIETVDIWGGSNPDYPNCNYARYAPGLVSYTCYQGARRRVESCWSAKTSTACSTGRCGATWCAPTAHPYCYEVHSYSESEWRCS